MASVWNREHWGLSCILQVHVVHCHHHLRDSWKRVLPMLRRQSSFCLPSNPRSAATNVPNSIRVISVSLGTGILWIQECYVLNNSDPGSSSFEQLKQLSSQCTASPFAVLIFQAGVTRINSQCDKRGKEQRRESELANVAIVMVSLSKVCRTIACPLEMAQWANGVISGPQERACSCHPSSYSGLEACPRCLRRVISESLSL